MKNKNKKNEISIRSSAAEYLTYVAAAGDDKDSIEVRYEDENIWLTQKMLATVYGVTTSAINQHLKTIYEDSELDEDSTIKNFLIVRKEGNREVSRNIAHYNLQMIIAIGFKVDNERAVQFRKWANKKEINVCKTRLGRIILFFYKKNDKIKNVKFQKKAYLMLFSFI